jgi:signal transduction histidine kinase
LKLAMAAIPSVMLLLTWLSSGAVDRAAESFDRALAILDELAVTENALQRDVLTARTGMLRDYDPIVHEVEAEEDALSRLRLGAPTDRAMEATLDRLAASMARQEELVEQFKTDNALLQNSLAYFSFFSSRIESADQTALPVFGRLSAAMLRLMLDASEDNARAVDDRLNELSALPQAGDSRQAQALLAHGRLLHDFLPATDMVLKAIAALPQSQNREDVRAALLQRQIASREKARRFRFTLYAVSLLLVGSLVWLGFQLRKSVRTLHRRAAFEHVIASASMRFVTAEPQETGALIEEALAEMAGCVGADRAYFILAGPAGRIHAWRRADVTFPPDWPDGALSLIADARPDAAGIVHIRDVGELHHGGVKDRLGAAGVTGWACAANIDRGEVSTLLGFDVVRGPFRIAHLGELSLLRTAMDTINNAIEHEFLERERAHLQQARRLEAIGTLASGIAHNFNNIIGAILGYTEMAEAEAAGQDRLSGTLADIRRSGERAQDLIDQVLTFGRRRSPTHAPVSVGVLITEAKSLLTASLPSRIRLLVHDVPAATVLGEFAQLQQVILNLCSNAAQSIDGQGTAEISTEIIEVSQPRRLSYGELPAGRYARISVRDTGRGIDRATMEHLFELFFTTRPDGHGLGLATVLEIVREHGGALDVRSAVGSGSTFEVWLPCAAVTLLAAGDPPALSLGHGETVLLVTEDRERLFKDEETLAALGYEPVGFTQEHEALAAYCAAPGRFDAVLIVCRCAETGLDFAFALSRCHPHLPIVLATWPKQEVDYKPLRAAGISEQVHYPLLSAELAGALARCLSTPAIGQ